MQKIFLLLLIIFSTTAFSQTNDQPFIKLVNPSKLSNTVFSSRQFIIGSTCKNCKLTINEQPVKVYATGAFALELNLTSGDSSFAIKSEGRLKVITKKIDYSYILPRPADTVKTLDIESITTYPEGDLLLQPGDKIKIKVKSLPGMSVRAFRDIVLYEMPVGQTNGMPGIYQAEYIVKPTDSFLVTKIPVTVMDSMEKKVTRLSKYSFSMMSSYASDIAVTRGRLAHLEYGLGDDRLGGAKVGYLDSNIALKIIGKVGSHFKIQLAKNRIAYIPDELVDLAPKGTFAPESLTGKWNMYGDEKYDYIKVGLFARLPYQSLQLTDPSRIVVDIFGATSNTNWITQMQSVKEIEKLDYEQVADDIFRITIQLKHAQHWGHQIFYQGNNLIIKIKQQPANLSLSNLIIAVDAGHGGTNNGGVGATGTYEKEVTLDLSLKLQQALEKEGAKVIMTRTEEKFVDNKERILFFRDCIPDLLLSVHLNSSEDPFRAGGTGTFYRYIGFKNLSLDIYKRLLELGLKEYGNTGSFNFMLNSPIEYPNALIETLFLSNLEEEEKILDPVFQQQMVDKIVLGVKDFLEGCKK